MTSLGTGVKPPYLEVARKPSPVVRAAQAVAVRTVACVVLGGIAAVALLGVLDWQIGLPGPFQLGAEGGTSALFSTGLLAAGGGLAVLLGARRFAPGGRATWMAMGAFLGFMALDELLGVHEALERWTGVDWQLLYLPVVVIGGMAWLRALYVLRHGHAVAQRLLVAGAAAWFTAQVLEHVQWDDADRLAHPWMVVPEEMLEMTGSMLFGLAFLVLLKEAVGPVAADDPWTDSDGDGEHLLRRPGHGGGAL
jgi:hypothetical protein